MIVFAARARADTSLIRLYLWNPSLEESYRGRIRA